MNLKILENIKSPDDIKSLSNDELRILSDEIRQALIYNVSNTGGHLASNLGVVELTIAVHKVFDSPKDQIVFDVGHQCYVHKMLTGRFEEFYNLRKSGGLSGFPSPDESCHDIFKTGHSSTSISSALGLAYAKSLDGDNDSSVVAVIGDGSMTGGLAYEGLNNAGGSGKNIVVILNDNKMSISRNVGSVSKALTRLRNKSGYFRFKDAFANFLINIPCIGKSLYRRLNRMKSAIKTYFYSSNLFESMGFKYIGPIDGHNIEMLTRVLKRAKSLKCPVLVHVNTKKGKGYSFAEDRPLEYHGVGEFNVGTGESSCNKPLSFTDAFSSSLATLGQEHENICAITAAMGPSCGLDNFKSQFPKRCFDVGIAEQHAVTFASGLARMGYLPVFAVYSTFLQRAYDQIIHDVCLQKLKVIFAVDRAGIVGEDGETHQGLFGIPMLLPIPGILIFSPSTATELEHLLRRIVERETTSCVLRYPKDSCISYTDYPFKEYDADWEIFCGNCQNAVVSYGREVIDVLGAVKTLKSVDVVKLNLINRFDDELLERLSGYKKIIFPEECYKTGGIAMLLQNALCERNYKGRFYSRAIENGFIKHATQKEIKHNVKLDCESVREFISACLDD